MSRITLSGETFDCAATPYPWPFGVGVRIDVTRSDKHVGSLLVLCAANDAAFHSLASLSPSELCDLALSRFVAGELPVALERILWWQERISAMGHDYVSPLGSAFSQPDPSRERNPGAGLPHIECSITFLTRSEGGRSLPLPRGGLSGNGYRPHLVIGDPAQRHSVSVDGRGIEEYIGVAFHDGPAVPEAGTEMTTVLTLMYYPHPMYDKLKPGVTFTVQEGAHVVGFGNVRRWVD